MHELKIKNSRGASNIYYLDKDYKAYLSINLDEYEILIIDSILKNLNPDLYKLCLKKSIKVFELNSGEDTKRIDNVFNLLNKIDDLNIYPINKVLVVGGGTIQDISATCLGLIKRGTNWDFIPTTILAQCDSCIGSKTSINSFKSKNLYGLFYAPKNIYIINSLALKQTNKDLLSGFGDALHYLFLSPENEYIYINTQLNKIKEKGIKNYFNEKECVLNLASHCHKIKKKYVEIDEFDKKERKHLNLGHSFGHALETLFNYEIPHGIAVMHGIYMAYYLDLVSNERPRNKNLDRLITELIYILDNQTDFNVKTIQDKIHQNLEVYISILKKDKKNISNQYILIALSPSHPYILTTNKLELEKSLNKIYNKINIS